MPDNYKHIPVEKIEDAIRAKRGCLSSVAAFLGISRYTVYQRIKEFPQLQQVIDEARENHLDDAERRLHEYVEGVYGEKLGLTALIFYLKTQGKARGFVERQEQLVDMHAQIEGWDVDIAETSQDD